jgi:hypothetical protein
MRCGRHDIEATERLEVELPLYGCDGQDPGCGTFLWSPSHPGRVLATACSRGHAVNPKGPTPIAVEFCSECFPGGVSATLLANFVPATIIHGLGARLGAI